MDKRKRIVNQTTQRNEVSETGYNNGEKFEQNCMLLSTTYGLNSSYTKKIHVGLQTSSNEDNFDFQPAVKLTAKGAEGISFNMVEWRKFQENMELMSNYLNGKNIDPSPIIINKVIINFTTTYGTRALLLANQEQEEQVSKNIDAQEIEQTPKKRKIYSVAMRDAKSYFRRTKKCT